MSELLVYTCHQSFGEVQYRAKYHVIDACSGTGAALCGYHNAYFGGVLNSEVNKEWFEINKPSNDKICQHCKKKALKLLTDK